MMVFKRYGKPAAIVFALLGLLLIILSFILAPKPTFAQIWLSGSQMPYIIDAKGTYVANWLLDAGVHLFPHDSIRYAGLQIPHDFELKGTLDPQLVYKPAVPVYLTIDGRSEKFFSGADTLGKALWERAVFLKKADHVSEPLDTMLEEALYVTIKRSQPITLISKDKEIVLPVSAATVGEALSEAGYALQNLDYSEPAEDAPIPDDRIIHIIRVYEEVITEEISIPYVVERISDTSMDVGQEQVLQSGKNGVQSTTARVRYEDGEEVSRSVLTEWVSEPPVTERIAYGGNVVVQTFDSSEGAVDYWLEMDVRVTTYHDTGNPTASGIWPYYGAIAVKPEWYSILKGTSIYVPGYGVGTVLDVCPGCVGQPWIDVFIPIDQYVAWSKNLTVYFLPPAPENFSGELP